MKVPLKWLSEYVSLTIRPVELAERLTMAGLEVKEIKATGESWDNIVVGEIISLEIHPDANHLKISIVDSGKGHITTITGAPNLNIGDKVPLALTGARIRDGHTGEIIQLKPAKIRGIISEGTLCSEKELGISESHEGVMILPPEVPVGIPLREYLGDMIFDFDITPNRPDCLSIIGIAREVAALTNQTITLPRSDYEETSMPVSALVSVEIIEPSLCSRYCASLISGVKVGKSPRWLLDRLVAYGMRPINNIVDITNYVMLEFGQPLHAFDYDKIKGRKIIVRRAQQGESLITLDGVERILNSNLLLIADKERAIAIAGIMGGQDTEVTAETTTVLLEAANFDRASIRRGSKALSLRTEASLRFDKGLPPELALPALRRATALIVDLAEGKAAQDIIDCYPGRKERKPILFSMNDIQRLLGMGLELNVVTKVLASLGFNYESCGSPSNILVTPPYWRSDINLSADLVEEIARIIGYYKIPLTMLSAPLPAQEPEPKLNLRKKVRAALVACGFQEVLTYSLTSLEMLMHLTSNSSYPLPMPLHLANPMSKEQEYLRTTLRANLLATLARNQRYEERLWLFEIGKIFLPQGENLPHEVEMLCAVLSGQRAELTWNSQSQPVDFFDAKGAIEILLSRLGLKANFAVGQEEGFHPGKQAEIIVGDKKIGVIGEVNRRILESFEISKDVYLFEINLEMLLPYVTGFRKYQSLPRFPAVVRDLALVMDKNINCQKVQNIIESFPLVRNVQVFDVYSGKQVPEGKKSLAYRIMYQSLTHTLTEGEVKKAEHQILDRLYQELGITLRAN